MSEVDRSETSSNQVATSKSRKNSAGNRTDIGWKHGKDVQGNDRKVKCNYCAKVVSGEIFRFKHHLAGIREDSEPCAIVPEEIKTLMLKIVTEAKVASQKRRKFVYEGDEEGEEEDKEQKLEKRKDILSFARKGKSTSSGVQSTINQMMKKDYKEQVDQQVAQFFYTSAIPFNCVKNAEFAKMCEMIGRYGIGYKPPSYHEIREKHLKQAVTRTDAMLQEFKDEWKRTGCSIMSDGWTDKKRRSICNFLVNSPKGTVFLYSLDTSDISKTTEKVFKMLDDVVTYVGEENVVQVVTDNAANYKAAGEMLMQTRKHLYWTPCAAHCIDLILEDFEKKLKVHQVTIKKARKITTYIYSRSMLISMLKNFTKGKDLVRPAVTRFSTAYLTLSCFHDNKATLMSLFSSEDWKSSKFASSNDGKRIQSMVLDSRLWKNILICLKAAAPLITVLRLVDSDEKPAMGFIYEGMDCAKERIKGNFNNVKKSYEPIWNIIDERWEGQLHRPLHAAAYYLNPHYHYGPTFRDDDFEVKQGLYSCMERLVAESNERNKISVQLAEFHYARGLFGLETAKSSRQTMPPAEWWDFYGDGCPELKRFAIRVLSLTCSSSGCERNWSAFEMVHTKRRNRLHQKKMNDLVYVMYNLKLKGKQLRRNPIITLDEINSDDEWITEIGDASNEEEVVQPLREDPIPRSSQDTNDVDEVRNIDIIESAAADNANFDEVQNMVIDAIGEESCSSEEELDDNGDEELDDNGDEDDDIEDDDGGGFEF